MAERAVAITMMITLMSAAGLALHAAPTRNVALGAASRTAPAEPRRHDPQWPPESFDFKCTGCGKCCAAPDGDVWMSASEVSAAATALGLARAAFVERFVESQREGGDGGRAPNMVIPGQWELKFVGRCAKR